MRLREMSWMGLLLVLGLIISVLHSCAAGQRSAKISGSSGAASGEFRVSHRNPALAAVVKRETTHIRRVCGYRLSAEQASQAVTGLPFSGGSTGPAAAEAVYADFYVVGLHGGERCIGAADTRFPATLNCAAQLYAMEHGDFEVSFRELWDSAWVPYADLLPDKTQWDLPIGSAVQFQFSASTLVDIGSPRWAADGRKASVMACFDKEAAWLNGRDAELYPLSVASVRFLEVAGRAP